jgi:hypothetical protein
MTAAAAAIIAASVLPHVSNGPQSASQATPLGLQSTGTGMLLLCLQ